jgi:hypothetical protein
VAIASTLSTGETGTISPGMGLALKSRRQGFAIHRASQPLIDVTHRDRCRIAGRL